MANGAGEVNGIEMTIGWQPVKPKTFVFHSDVRKLSFYALTMRELSLVDLKQITIPQPSEDCNMEHYTKQEEEFEMEQRNMAAKENREVKIKGDSDHLNDGEFLSWIYDRLHLVYGEDENVDYMHRLRGISFRLNERHPLKPIAELFDRVENDMKENGDNLMFGGEDKCKEWPCVGDDVLISGLENDNRCIDFEGELVTIASKSHINGVDVVTFHNDWQGYGALAVGDHFKRPKTPEEELRDEIYDIIHSSAAGLATKTLLQKYNITKKPQ